MSFCRSDIIERFIKVISYSLGMTNDKNKSTARSIDYLVKKRPIHEEDQIMSVSELEPGKQYLGLRMNESRKKYEGMNFTYVGDSNIKECIEIKRQGEVELISPWVWGIEPTNTNMWHKDNYVVPAKQGEQK